MIGFFLFSMPSCACSRWPVPIACLWLFPSLSRIVFRARKGREKIVVKVHGGGEKVEGGDSRQRDVPDLNIVIPLVEKLDVADLLDDILGEDIVGAHVLDLDIAAVRHFRSTFGGLVTFGEGGKESREAWVGKCGGRG
ncbi:hypothetical protein LX32DRAFT_438387 [Colletotrichum zoysiae]|uniref:Uncharacterized protein n=1 Tax=Colletotrichum zoysiae TaxID=1216348 RepID=A0AAD9LYP2_9PEZI|nr:hypothetical protein LX32DRAFT_438387 [Colletotrichum zoysiae]